MASTAFELTLRVLVFTLTIAIATLPACAEEIPCNTETICRIGKAKFIVKTIVTPSVYHESQKVEIRNRTSIKRLYDDIETVTSESTTKAAHCSFEETTAVELGALLDAGELTLVTLVAGETRLTAHRAVLAARSPVFAAMLCHGSQDARNSQVAIPDVEGPVLRQLLEYLYTLQAPQLPSMAPQLLAAANKFGLSALKSHCETQVAAQLAVETAVATAVLAIRHSSTSLTQEAITFMRAHLVQVIATQGWADAVRHQPEDFIEVNRLLTKLPVETSPQNDSLGSTPTAADRQPTTEAQSSQGQTPATSADSQPTTEAQSSQGQTPGTSADSQPTTEAQSSQGQTPATTADSQPTTEAQSSQGQTPATSADSHPTTGAQSSQGQTHATIAAPMPPCPPEDADSFFWRFSSEEKGRRLREWAYQGRLDLVEALLAAGTDVGAGDGGRMTALHWAAQKGHLEVARLLLACGAEVGARDSTWQETPLHFAAWRGHTAVVRLLLAASADPNARNESGWTPLHRAAVNGHAETAAALVEAGADKGAKTNGGRTPLDVARTFNRQQVIQLLT